MALSNIFREPRREITETIVGALVILVPLTALLVIDYWVVTKLLKNPDKLEDVAIGMVLLLPGMAIGLAVLGMLAEVFHAAGERICNALDRRDIHLRPKRRF